jgi:Putative adhesin
MTRLFRSRMVALAGCLLLAASGAACDVSLGNGDFSLGLVSGQSTDTWTRNYTIAAGGRLEVVNVNGLVQVEPGTGPAVEIRAERHAKASSDEAAKDLLGKVQMLEDIKPDSVRLEAKPPKTFHGGVDIKFFVKVPASLNVVARTVNGGIKLIGVPNDVEASTTNGGVEAEQVSGTLRVTTTNGGVRLALSGLGKGGLRAQTVNGGVDVELPKNAAANLSARVVNGGLGVDNLQLEAVGEQTRRRLEGKLNGGGPLIDLGTTNGGIHLTGK